MPGRYGASDDDPRIDPSFSVEGYADPSRVIGPIRATTPLPSNPILAGPVSIGADTGCANAVLRVTGSGHFTGALGIGLCPPNQTSGNVWINNQLVVGTDPGGTEALRVNPGARFNGISYFQGAGGGVVLVTRTTGTNWTQYTLGGTLTWHDDTPADRLLLTSTNFTPAVAGGLSLGTASLPWGASSFAGLMNLTTSGNFQTAVFQNLNATNDVSSVIFAINAGADVTLGALYLNFDFFPSATGANRRVRLRAGDNLAYRAIRFGNDWYEANASAFNCLTAVGFNLGTAALPWSTAYVGTDVVFSSAASTQTYQLHTTSDNLYLYDHGGSAVYQFGTVAFVPSVAAARALGTATLQWSDLFLGTTGTARVVYITSTGSTKRNWMVSAQNNIDQGFEITPSTANGGTTFSTPLLRITAGGTSSGVQINDPGTAFNPTVGGQLTLGDSTHAWANTYISNTSFLYFLDNAGALGGRINVDAGNVFNIFNANNQPLNLGTNNTFRWQLAAAGHLFAFADNTYDIGNSGGPNRPRNVYIAGNLVVGGTITPAVSTLFIDTNKSSTGTGDQSVTSFSLPAGKLATNAQQIRITLGWFSGGSASNTLTVKFGATALITVAPPNNSNGFITIIVARTGATTQISDSFCMGNTLVVANDFANRAIPGETLANAITIDFRANPAAGGTITYDHVAIEFIST